MLVLINQHHFLIVFSWDATQRECKSNEHIVKNKKRFFNHVFQLEQLKNYQGERNFTQKQWLDPTTWKDMLENAFEGCCELVKRENGAIVRSFQVLAWMIIRSRRRNLKYAPRLDSNACTWHESGRNDILWSVNNLARSVTKWTQACDRRLARLISYIHHTSNYHQYCYVGNTANIVDWVYFKTQALLATLRT